MRKIILVIVFLVFSVTVFTVGYIIGHVQGFQEGSEITIKEIYSIHNVHRIPMQDVVKMVKEAR